MKVFELHIQQMAIHALHGINVMVTDKCESMPTHISTFSRLLSPTSG